MNGQVVETVSQYTYLGFVLDDKLTFYSHAKKLIQSSISKVCTLSKIRKFISSETAVTIFKSFILPKLEYGDVFCCGLTKKLSQKLQVVLNKALRICFRSKREDSNYENHLKAKILPLHIRRKCSILRLMYGRARNECIPVAIDDDSSVRQTRSKTLPRMECLFPHSESYKKSISYTGLGDLAREVENYP